MFKNCRHEFSRSKDCPRKKEAHVKGHRENQIAHGKCRNTSYVSGE